MLSWMWTYNLVKLMQKFTDAISLAIKETINKMGIGSIKSSEFFGIKQKGK